MENKNLVRVENEGFLTKIKNWFKNLFTKRTDNSFKQQNLDLEFEQQKNIKQTDFEEQEKDTEQIKYEFSTQTVSKQKLEKIKLELDKGKIGVEELYQMSDEELVELSKMYDNQIEDTVSKLNEVEFSIEGYKRKISKIQAQI